MKVRSVSNVSFLMRLGFLITKSNALNGSEKGQVLTTRDSLLLYPSRNRELQ